ncbi:transketolase [Desulfobacterota bacterium AH_259_B03_O07]|nr:transketolase [Desulfobacterota bacterium AH_259_B03_O07]
MSPKQNSEQLVINTIRTLSMDAVQKANSGHPGTPMSMAPVAYTIWDKFMHHNPKNPDWPNRDRFVLSAGHASMLLYSIFHVNGYGVSLNDIKTFRQLHSICAGHPEYGLIPGIESTTGPLGQGVATSVGMAIAEKWLSTYFNRPGHEIINYKIFALAGDGCMMEGISSEAASLAGHLGLSNLIWIYDNNHITIEGHTALAFSEDVAARFMGYNWHVQRVGDANDLELLEEAFHRAIEETEQPSFIIVDSHIGYGSPNKQDTSAAHGEPLGEEEIRKTKMNYGWDPKKKFYVPEEVKEYRNSVVEKGRKVEEEWEEEFSKYEFEYPELAKQFKLIQNREMPDGWDSCLPTFPPDDKGPATRISNSKILNAIGANIPWFFGGAADVGSSTKTYLDNASSFEKNVYSGRNFHFGVRENAMAAVTNGMVLSKIRAYASCYFVFSDYMRAPLRLSCLMQQPVIYIFTHDSIALGEDGPTHQPIEHLASLRAIPNMDVIRPSDANELSVLWKYIMEEKDHPVALILTRQGVPTFDRNKYASSKGALRGAYILADSTGRPDVILIGTGSEVQFCIGAHEKLKRQGIKSRVVSMPSMSLFEVQDPEYREEVLPSSIRARLAVEAGSTYGWGRYIGIKNVDGGVIGMRDFGESAPIADLLKEFGLTADHVVAEAKRVITRIRKNSKTTKKRVKA